MRATVRCEMPRRSSTRMSRMLSPSIAAAAAIDGESILLMRVEDLRGISHLTVARIDDGRTGWHVDPEPTLMPDPDHHPEEVWGIEDPRITWLPEREEWAIAYTAFS